jgi:hypothetical protein
MPSSTFPSRQISRSYLYQDPLCSNCVHRQSDPTHRQFTHRRLLNNEKSACIYHSVARPYHPSRTASPAIKEVQEKEPYLNSPTFVVNFIKSPNDDSPDGVEP